MNLNKPPRWAIWIVRLFCQRADQFSILDDLEIEYQERLEEKGRSFASIWYLLHSFRAVPELILTILIWRITMFRNYFKMSYRSLFKNKLFGFISVFSLSMAIGAVIAIFFMGDIIFNFESFHKNGENIFQVQNIITREGNDEIWSKGPVPLGPALKKDFPQIKYAVRMDDAYGTMRYKDRVFDEYLTFADKEFLDMFTFPLIMGDKSALAKKDAVILAEETAIKYFGQESSIGKQITIHFESGKVASYFIQGVAKKFPGKCWSLF